MYVGGIPPEEEQRLKIAKRNWRRMLSGASPNAEVKKPQKITPRAAESVYSQNTPEPNLKRDVFETVKHSFGMKFVNIAPGTFIMGSPEGEPGRNGDEVQHKVKLTQGFYMQNTAVTVGQWREFVKSGYKSEGETEGGAYTWTGKDWKKQKDIYWDHPGFKQTDSHPVTCISWNDAQAFIKWLDAKENCVYRLPTEAEWEYACRAGTMTPFAFGECLSTDEANYNGIYPLAGCLKGAYRKRTVPAGCFAPNAWGLYGMHGNGREWCHDWYGKYKANSVTDPTGPIDGSLRVLRGGGWYFHAKRCRSASRSGNVSGRRDHGFGFRLVLPAGQ